MNESQPADLDIGVIYTHEDQFMGPLLETLARSGDDLRLRLILIDNASYAGVEAWSHRFAHTRVLRNPERLGYAANLNRILGAATSEFVLLLNTDMYFHPPEQCLSKLVQFLREQPKCGLAACRLYHPDGEYGYPARRYQTLRTIAARRGGMKQLFPNTLARYVYADRSRYDSFPCDWVSGCLMLVRREALQQIGGFDCRYGKYFEDVDVCSRLAAAGWQVMFHGGTYAFHHEQRASKPLLSRDAWRHLRAYGLWLAKAGVMSQGIGVREQGTGDRGQQSGVSHGRFPAVLAPRNSHHSRTTLPATPITILLAAYNGAAFLAEQIESIQRQTYTAWRLLIRDDGSTDRSVEVVREFAAHDPRVELLTDARGRLGVVGNFAALAESVGWVESARPTQPGYVAFCDQDDVWHPQKLAMQLECMQAAERDSAPHTPLAVHTDLAVVDSRLRPLHPSFLRFQGLWHESDRPLRTLVVQNFVTGCTLLVNRALLEVALPMPPQALVHDWWLALCAAATGRLEFLPQATVDYRQHGGNTIGAKRWFSPAVWPKLKQLANRGKSLRDALDQADALRQRIAACNYVSAENRTLLDAYCRLQHEVVPLRRAHHLYQLSTRRQGRLRNAALFAQTCLLEVRREAA